MQRSSVSHESLRSTRHLPGRVKRKCSKLQFARRRVLSPISPPQSPPRLRRLGVRQAGEDRSFIFTVADSVKPSERRQKEKPRSHGHHVDEGHVERKKSNSTTIINPMGKTTVLKCPICAKVFLSFYGHDVHLDIHDSAAIKCWTCNLRFNSNKSLVQHQRLRHNRKKEKEKQGCTGFHNLIFADFSCKKFAAVCQRYCEKQTIPPECSLHDYSCTICQKAFPMQEALDLHIGQFHYYPSKYICTLCHHDYRTKVKLEEHKLKYPCNSKRHLADSKRRFIRALSLMPQCAAENMLRHKQVPAINMAYHEKLKSVPSVTKAVYEVAEVRSEDEEESDSSQS